MKNTMRISALLFAVLFLFCSCGSKEPSPSPSPTATVAPTATPNAAISPTPDASDSSSVDEPDEGDDSTAKTEVQADSAVAYYFDDVGGSPTLYAAVTYTNTTGAPAVVESVTVEITSGSNTHTETFTPPMAASDIVAHGQQSSAAVWISGDVSKFDTQDPFTVTATVMLSATDQEPDERLSVSNLLLIQNYPGFATLSGRIENSCPDRNCDLAMVYVTCFDQEGNLLGVTCFTKNLSIPAEDSRDFVHQLRDLPIPALADNTVTIECRALWLS